MTTELRDYRVAEGHLDDFIAAWSNAVVPLRQEHGFLIGGSWASRADNRFVWLLSLDGDRAKFERQNAAYYDDPRRIALDPDPARWIEESSHSFVDAVPFGHAMPPFYLADDVRLRLPPAAGSMAALFRAFDERAVRFHGLAGSVEGDLDAVHILVEDPDAAAGAAAASGAHEAGRRKVIVVELSQIPLTATEILTKIAQAGVMIDLIYLAANGALVIGAEPLAAAMAVLGET